MRNYITDYEQFDRINAYNGALGAICDGETTIFRVWAPFCTAVTLRLYTGGEGDNLIQTLSMQRRERGVWQVELMHTCYGMYYTYQLEYEHREYIETIDIYAKACGINGERGYIPDFRSLDPEGWDDIKRPVCENPVDAVIYECHVRDFSIDGTSGIPDAEWQKRGRFAGFTVEGTRYNGVTTCLDHLKELGITHVQLMPVNDYATVNEKKPYAGQYNWGYDPKNYMCLEGYYCSDPEEGDVRIREFKELVAALHKAGIGVILDVVFNHTYYPEESAFHKTVPYYYHRLGQDGRFSNGSGCGNETASNHAMYRKYMLDALRFWVSEYKVDGFRFAYDSCLVETLQEHLQGMISQPFLTAKLQTEHGEVELYGYADYVGADMVIDLKTTTNFTAGKYRDHWQHRVYPYCLVRGGMMESVSEFTYLVAELREGRDGTIGGTIYCETYATPIDDCEREIRQGLDSGLLAFIEDNRSVITDGRVFGN